MLSTSLCQILALQFVGRT